VTPAQTLQHRTDGPDNAPVLVLGPALGTTWHMWDRQIPELTRNWRVLRFDLPGHGGSPAYSADSADSFAERLLATLDRLGIMIAQDLEQYERETRIILEGAAYLPELLELNEANPNNVIFLVPTKEFQLHYYSQRPWVKSILKECEDPEQAFANWMMRDHLFGEEILRQAKARNYKTILVDRSRSIDQQYENVKEYFGLC